MDFDLGRRAIDFPQVVSGELNAGRAEVLLQSIAFRRSRDWHDPRLLCQQPGQGDLRRCGFFAPGEGLQPLDEGEIRLPILLGEAGDDVAEVGRIERGLVVDLAGEKTFAQGTEWHEANSEFLERRQGRFLRLSPPEGVLALESGNRLHGVGATDGLHACFGQPEVPDLAFADQILHRTRHVLDRDVRIHTMLIEEIDAIGIEPLQRSLSDLAHVRRAAVEARLLAVLELESELGRNDHLIADRPKRLADELFVREWSVRFGRIEEGYATFECRPNDRESVFAVASRAVTEADAHAPEAECRHFETALAQRPFLHCVLSPCEPRNDMSGSATRSLENPTTREPKNPRTREPENLRT